MVEVRDQKPPVRDTHPAAESLPVFRRAIDRSCESVELRQKGLHARTPLRACVEERLAASCEQRLDEFVFVPMTLADEAHRPAIHAECDAHLQRSFEVAAIELDAKIEETRA